MDDDQDITAEEGSQLSHLLEELELFGRRPFDDELDPRPLPEARLVEAAAADSFDAIIACLSDTRLEPELEDILWGFTNVFHRASERVDRDLDANELAQARSQREQDGSEVKSVELERLIAEGRSMIERRDAMEAFREAFADQFRHFLRKPWLPRAGSALNHRAMTAAVVDSRDFVNARRWTDSRLLLPPGQRIYVSGGADYNDHRKVWQVLDDVHSRHPDMLLMHGGSRTGAERIAALWAAQRNVTQMPFAPDFTKHSRGSAPFKRNDLVLSRIPRGRIHIPGGGLQDHPLDTARLAGIPNKPHPTR